MILVLSTLKMVFKTSCNSFFESPDRIYDHETRKREETRENKTELRLVSRFQITNYITQFCQFSKLLSLIKASMLLVSDSHTHHLVTFIYYTLYTKFPTTNLPTNKVITNFYFSTLERSFPVCCLHSISFLTLCHSLVIILMWQIHKYIQEL